MRELKIDRLRDRDGALDPTLGSIEIEILLQSRDVELAIGVDALRRDRAVNRGVLESRIFGQNCDDLLAIGTFQQSVGQPVVVEPRATAL